MTVAPEPNQRRALLARVHAAKKRLGWDETTYRETLRTLTGFDSAAQLDLEALRVLAQSLESRSKPRPHCSPEKQPLIRKIIAVLLNTPGIRKPGRDVLTYADSTAHEMFFRDQNVTVRVEFLEEWQLWKLIQALEINKKRKGGRDAG